MSGEGTFPSAWRQAAVFVAVSVCCSFLVSLAMITYSLLFEPNVLSHDGSEPDLVAAFFGFAIIAWFFVFPGQLVIGVPALLIARRFDLPLSRDRFLIFGGFIGLLGAVASVAVWLGAGPGLAEGMPGWLSLGGLSGVFAALLWWLMVERFRRVAQ